MTDETMLTVADVAERLKVSEVTVGRWLRSGRLKGTRLGGTKLGWRIAEADVRQLVVDGQPAVSNRET